MPSAGSMLVSAYYRLYARYNMGAIADSVIGRGLMWAAGTTGKVLHSIGLAKDKPWFARTSMRSVRKIMPEARTRVQGRFHLPEGVHTVSDLRVAGILDRFSHLSFSFDCQMLPLSTLDWRERIEEFKPHLLLVESAWEGLDESWRWKVSIVSPELVELIVYCRRNGIPTVFWNKEDPKHFETFIRAAELFDVVFTTDVDKIPDYLDHIEGGRVYLLPFAAQPAIHNPIETYERIDAFCFAGSYYTKQMERNRTFARIVTALSDLGKVDIYDRYLNTKDERLAFPGRFLPFIVGTLDPTEIDRAYKGYYYGLNMNTVRSSQTMFSRRALELLASNTVVIGNYSRGLRIFLGDLTISTDNVARMREMASRLRMDPSFRDSYRLAGLRKVMSQHTYKHRLLEIVERVFGADLKDAPPTVAVVSDPRDEDELAQVRSCFNSQTYPHRGLFLILTPGIRYEEGGTIISSLREARGDLLAYMCPSDSYGPEYLKDLVLASNWSGSGIVGKGTFKKGRGRELQNPGLEYRFVDHVLWRRALVAADLMEDVVSKMPLDRDVSISGPVVLSTDRFNYVAEARIEDWDEERPVRDYGLDMAEVKKRTKEGEGFIYRSDILRVFGRYPRTSMVFRAPYLHARNLASPLADIACTAGETTYYDLDGLEVASLSPEDLVMALSAPYRHVEFHLMDRSMLRAYEALDGRVPLEVWVYGPEVELALQGKGSCTETRQRMSTERQMKTDEWISLLRFPSVRFVFASASLARDMETLGGTSLATRSRIIPVLMGKERIDLDLKRERRGLLIAKPYWGAELDLETALKIVREMTIDPRFKDLPVTLYGDWGRSVVQSKEVKSIPGLRLVRESHSPREKAALFASHSALLMPAVYDHNFALPLEAMGLGLVPIVNRIGATKEFLDERCGIMLSGDPERDAIMLLELFEDRGRIEGLSQGVVERARMVRHRALSL